MAHSVSDEAHLLARAREFDSRALSQIHDRYYPELYRYAHYRTGDRPVAEDIAAEVFVRLLDALHAGRAPHTTLRGWLFGVASHLVADHFRRAPLLPLADSIADDRSPAREAEERLRQAAVRVAVGRLTVEQQEVLALRFGSGCSVDQTAESLGKSAAAVKALQFRALESLRRILVEVDDE